MCQNFNVCVDHYMENGHKRSERAMATRIGGLFLNYVGKTFETERAKFVLRKTGNAAKPMYIFEKTEDIAFENDEILEMVSEIFTDSVEPLNPQNKVQCKVQCDLAQ